MTEQRVAELRDSNSKIGGICEDAKETLQHLWEELSEQPQLGLCLLTGSLTDGREQNPRAASPSR